MKEILFRGKRIDNGEWVEGYLFCHWEHAYILWGVTNGVPNMIEVDPATVSQYTGMTDENKKKIFEGDIVRDLHLYLVHKSYFEEGRGGEENYEQYREDAEMMVVQFIVEDVGSCGCCYPVFKGSGFIAYDVNLGCCEVVGNIHDNPELLR